MDNHEASPAVEAFWKYTQTFQSLDPRAIPQHFNEPAMMITPDGVEALPNPSAVEQTYRHVMERLATDKHYARTDFSEIRERRLSDEVSVLSGSGSWIDADGNRTMRFGMTYTLRRMEQGWRIVVAVIHSPDVE